MSPLWLVLAAAAYGWHRLLTRLLRGARVSAWLGRRSAEWHFGATLAVAALDLLLLCLPPRDLDAGGRPGWPLALKGVVVLGVIPSAWLEGTRRWKALRDAPAAPAVAAAASEPPAA